MAKVQLSGSEKRALILWVLLDYRVQRKLLADLEARGVTRRSEPPR